MYVVREDDQARGGSVLHDRHRGSDDPSPGWHPLDEQWLVWFGQKLEGERVLGEYNIKDQSTLHMAEKTSRSRNKRPRRSSRPCSLCEQSTLHMAEKTSRSRNKRPRRSSRPCSLCEESTLHMAERNIKESQHEAEASESPLFSL